MTLALVPVAEAAVFTLGCIAIHALRRHADVVTATLACFATILFLLIGASLAPASMLLDHQSSDFAMIDPSLY
ncbi:hypothetical protein ACFQE0_25415 [Methylobacterium komagatae]|uniref:NADH-quinone oxidoreductase subunit N n=1 Tax=Methylobacterium komagatae TaxID=374425 RepID=A0ABW2BQ48_9HYPH